MDCVNWVNMQNGTGVTVLLESHGELIYKKDLLTVMEGAVHAECWSGLGCMQYVDRNKRTTRRSICGVKTVYTAYPYQGFKNRKR